MKYKLEIANLATQYIRIRVELKSIENELEIVFPAWRPGRYELGNFAKNVRNFQVFDASFKPVSFHKTEKNRWIVDSSSTDTIHLDYLYHASELNAGSTFVSDEQLYVNPVNCFAYAEKEMNENVSLEIDVNKNWQIATSMKSQEGVFQAKDYHELVDSPFIASPSMQKESYQVGGVDFHIWFQGEVKPDWKKIIYDFTRFTESQLNHFGDFPFEEYHFLFQITPYTTYHGVEHRSSTVIALGPSFDIMEGLYTEFLGVSSHELYHAWNVKTIRAKDMMPYDYSKENYSKLGYVCEGVTTYLGDQFLFKSNVFDLDQYLFELRKMIQRHFDNFGRFSTSVADSSFDTWLDGYVAGAPNRKTSIYVEGCLIALICDVRIMKNNGNKASINDVMRLMYNRFGKKNIGYSAHDYKQALEEVAGVSFDDIFEDLVNGTKNYELYLQEALAYIGITLTNQPSKVLSHSQLGVKTINKDDCAVVKQIFPGSDLDIGGVILEDKIIAMNGIAVGNNFEKWLKYFKDETNITLTIERSGRIFDIVLPLTSRVYFITYGLKKMEETTKLQREAFNYWAK